jgi:RNA polymerase sigma-70 factor (ECF subfamily)
LADDLLQQTFLKVHRARSTYVSGAAPLPWLYAIAHRTFLDEARRRRRAKVQLHATGEPVVDVAVGLTGRDRDFENDAGDRELADWALRALDALPASQREALVLTKLEGKSSAEAAAISGTTPGAIKLRAHRAYVTLRKLFTAEAKA